MVIRERCRNTFNTWWRKSVVSARFISPSENKICKNMNSIPKNLYIDKLVDLVNVYNITYKTNKMKPNDVKTSTYIDFGVQNNDKDLNLVIM